jgi:hypothetical protein
MARLDEIVKMFDEMARVYGEDDLTSGAALQLQDGNT